MQLISYRGALSKYLNKFDLQALWLFWQACKHNGVTHFTTNFGAVEEVSVSLTKEGAWKEFIYYIDGDGEMGYFDIFKGDKCVGSFSASLYNELESYENFLIDYTITDTADKIWHEVYDVLDKRFKAKYC